MDLNAIKEQVEAAVNKLKSDDKLLDEFKKEPIKTVEKLTGIDLPDDQLKKVVDGIKAKLTLDNIGGAVSGLKGLFGKKE